MSLGLGIGIGGGPSGGAEPSAPTTTMTVSIADNADPVNASVNYTYTITPTITGAADAMLPTVTTTLGNCTYVSSSGTGWTITRSGQVVTAQANALPSGAGPAISITVTAPSTGLTVATAVSMTATNATTATDSENTVVNSVFANVTRDTGNLNYFPASDTEWTTFRTAAGLTGGNYGNPASVWNLQEASGNYVDVVGGITLSDLGPTTHRVAITGTTRLGMRSSDGVANTRAINSTTAPNPSTTDVLVLMYLEFPGVAPAANRDMAGVAAAATLFDVLWLANGKLRLSTSANADTTNTVTGTRGWFAYRSRVTATADASLFTPAEIKAGTAATPLSGAVIWFGGQTGLGSNVLNGYMVEFAGAPARLTNSELSAMFHALGEFNPW